MFSEIAEIALVAARLGQFLQFLKTRVILILNFTRPHAITHTNSLSPLQSTASDWLTDNLLDTEYEPSFFQPQKGSHFKSWWASERVRLTDVCNGKEQCANYIGFRIEKKFWFCSTEWKLHRFYILYEHFLLWKKIHGKYGKYTEAGCH